ncbi:hypothetical protein JCM5353_007148 [Sporobolomyces roseus]
MSDAAFSILRIKRKRTTNQLPLDALVIEQPEPSTKRRKATHQIPPSLPQSQTTTTSRGIFRFAETVSLDSFDNPTKTRQVKDRISSFLKHPPHLSQRPLARIPSSASLRNNSNSSSSSSTVPSPSSTPTQKTRKLPSSAAQLRSNSRPGTASPLGAGSASPRAGSSTPTSAPPDRLAPYHLEKKRARYRIIERQREDSQAEIERLEEEEVRKGLRPPKVWSSVELREREEREKEEQTRIYDAIEEDLGQGGVRKKTKREMGRKEKEEDSRMMDNFGDMLKEYLTLQDSTESSSLSSSSSSSLAPPLPIADSSSSSDSEEEEEDADFVYDIYYRDLRPETSSTSTPSTPGGSGFDVSSLEGLKRIGELAGLEDDEELLREEADSESEEEDNADQDSNEENDYRNDYPDEESEDSDRWDEDDGESQGGDSDY